MIKEIEPGAGKVQQGEVSTLESKYISTEDIEWKTSTGATITESTPTTCTVETTEGNSYSFQLSGRIFHHMREIIPSRGNQSINNVEPTTRPNDPKYKYVEPEALVEINKGN